MDFYNEEKTARQYIGMAEGYDGASLIDALKAHVSEGATVLELGMGPGTDLDILKGHYAATGSDTSQFFLDAYRERNPEADLLFLDARELVTDRTWDCIYSNKVLHHFTDEELAASFDRQCALLSDGGHFLHSFWRGSRTEEHHGMRFVYRTEEQVCDLVESRFDVKATKVYEEMERDDSFYIIARKK